MKKTSMIQMALLLSLSLPAWGDEAATPTPSPSASPSPDPMVQIRPQRSYHAKRIALFPFEIPSFVLRGATYPLLELSRLMEREKVVEKLSDYFLKSNFVFYPILQAGGGDGFGGGFGFIARDMGRTGYDFSLNYTIFTDWDQRAGLALESPDYYLGNRPFRWEFFTRFRDKDDAKFYGVGPDSLEADKSLYGYSRTRVGAAWEYEFYPNLTLDIPLEFLTVETKPDLDGGQPSVEQVFPPSELVGFDQRMNYALLGAELVHDTRDSKGLPSHGGYRALRFTRYQGLNEPEFSFNEVKLDVRQYFRLWTPRHTLILRNAWVFQQSTGSGGIPFNLLTELDVNSPLRGFSTGRFRDTSSVLFNVEYRYPIWDNIDGTVFFDNGKVFNGIKDFSFSDWRYSVGGGIRFFYGDTVFMRLQAGYGGEGVVVIFRLGEVL